MYQEKCKTSQDNETLLSFTSPPTNLEGLEGGWIFGLESTKVHKFSCTVTPLHLAGQFSKVAGLLDGPVSLLAPESCLSPSS